MRKTVVSVFSIWNMKKKKQWTHSVRKHKHADLVNIGIIMRMESNQRVPKWSTKWTTSTTTTTTITKKLLFLDRLRSLTLVTHAQFTLDISLECVEMSVSTLRNDSDPDLFVLLIISVFGSCAVCTHKDTTHFVWIRFWICCFYLINMCLIYFYLFLSHSQICIIIIIIIVI